MSVCLLPGLLSELTLNFTLQAVLPLQDLFLTPTCSMQQPGTQESCLAPSLWAVLGDQLGVRMGRGNPGKG